MSQYTDEFIKSIQLIAQNAAASIDTTTVIECEILELLDPGLLKYKAKYLDNEIEVYGNKGTSFSIGEKVYVLVPNGDFSKTKTIISSSEVSAENLITTIDDVNKYIKISDNFITSNFSGTEDCIIKFNSYKGAQELSKDIVTFSTTQQITKEKFNEEFKGYFDNYGSFNFSFDVKTSLHVDQRNSGNYGAILSIPVLKHDKDNGGLVVKETLDYTLDIMSMVGTPYDFAEWTTQTLYINIDRDKYDYDINKIPSIKFFCQDFHTDSTKEEFDIFIRTPQLTVVEKIKEENLNGYYLKIHSTQGEYFNTYYSNMKTLTCSLYINGNITSLNSIKQVYWFKEDASIKLNGEGYSSIGGIGWKILNKVTDLAINEDGSKSLIYKADEQEYIVNKSEVTDNTKYKCVIIYNDKQVSATISLHNLDSGKFVALEHKINKNGYYVQDVGRVEIEVYTYLKDVTNLEENQGKIKYFILRYDKDGTAINDSSDYFEYETYNELVEYNGYACYKTVFSYPTYDLEEFNTILVSSHYYKNTSDGIEDILIGSKECSASTKNASTYNLYIVNGNKIFKYDSDGDSPVIEAYDGPAESKITSIDKLSYRIYKLDGTELSEQEYKACKYKWSVPKQSMISIGSNYTSQDDNYYYIEGYGVDNPIGYTIANKYNKNLTNNNIILTVEFDSSSTSATSSISFLKEGESGTNGTKYSSMIVMGTSEATGVPYGYKNEKGYYQKLKFVYNLKEDIWKIHSSDTNTFELPENAQKRLFAKVWYDGQILDSSKYNVTWEMFDYKNSEDTYYNITNPCLKCGNIINKGVWIIPIKTYKEELDKEIFTDGNKEKITLNTETVNIVKATIEIIDEDSKDTVQGTGIKLYAFYPVEVVITDYDSSKYQEYVEELGGNAEAAQVIPSIKGGFSEVLYASDGSNPSYDSSSPFEAYVANMYDDIFKHFYQMTWSAKNNINTENVKNTSFTYSVRPYKYYCDGNTRNYVKAKCVFGESRAAVEQECADAEAEYLVEKQNLSNSGKNLEILNNLIKAYKDRTTGYYSWTKSLNTVTPLLKELTGQLNILNDFNNNYVGPARVFIEEELGTVGYDGIYQLYTILNNLTNYLNVCCIIVSGLKSDNLSEYIEKINDIDDFYTSIENWINTENPNRTVAQELSIIDTRYQDKIDEVQNEPSLSQEEKDALIAELEANKEEDENKVTAAGKITYLDTLKETDYVKGVTLESLLQQLLLNGVGLTVEFDKIEDSGYDNYWEEYEAIYNNIISFFNLIPEQSYVYSFIKTIKEQGLSYAEQLKDCCSFSDLKEIIQNDINAKTLAGVFVVAYDQDTDLWELYLSKATEKYFNKEISLYNNQIATSKEKILQLKKILLNSETTTIIFKPIIFTLNSYEMSNINGWDGNKLELGDSYLLAPQVGAGLKDPTTNTFTGVVMGTKTLNKTSTTLTPQNSKIGLFGYSEGQQTFCLSAKDGSVVLGKAGSGRIVIDPSRQKSALLYSDNFFKPDYYDELTGLPTVIDEYAWNKEGLLIDLTTPRIIYGNGKFMVDEDGNLTVKGSDDKSKNKSTIAGWVITPESIHSDIDESQGRITLSSAHYTSYLKEDGSLGQRIDGNFGSLYSYNHKTLDDTGQGFYIGPEGISIDGSFKISAKANDGSYDGGELKIGNLKYGGNNYFTIGGYGYDTEDGNKASHSYIKFGCNSWAEAAGNSSLGSRYSVYIGTDGFAIGQCFSITPKGEAILTFGSGDTDSKLTFNKDGISVNGKEVLKGIPKFVLNETKDSLTIYAYSAYEDGDGQKSLSI